MFNGDHSFTYAENCPTCSVTSVKRYPSQEVQMAGWIRGHDFSRHVEGRSFSEHDDVIIVAHGTYTNAFPHALLKD